MTLTAAGVQESVPIFLSYSWEQRRDRAQQAVILLCCITEAVPAHIQRSNSRAKLRGDCPAPASSQLGPPANPISFVLT